MKSQLNTIAEFEQCCGLVADSADFAIVSLGANLPSAHGGPRQTLEAAIERLQQLSMLPVVVSPSYETEPLDCPPGSPRFVNAVVALYLPGQEAVELLYGLQRIELDFGRQRSGIRHEARLLDLDLISCGEQRISSEVLTLPHPRAHQRAFVLAPLVAIWPAYRLPGQSQTARTLLENLQ